MAEAELADLAAAVPGEGEEESKRFGLLVLQAELAALAGDSAPAARIGAQLVGIAAALQDQGNIPRIAAQLPLIEKRKRKIVYADFEDTLGEVAEAELEGVQRRCSTPPTAASA